MVSFHQFQRERKDKEVPMRDRAMKTAFIAGYFLIVVISMIVLSGHTASSGQKNRESKVVFAVHCYDDGAKALQGMPGVIRIEKGFRSFREIDTVYYDPAVITVEKMENTLKQAGTYRETVR
jgi:hypothetical protein